MMIVRYLMGGIYHATRHVEGCATLARALRDQDEAPARRWKGGGYGALQVMPENAYAGQHPAPKDHRCVASHGD